MLNATINGNLTSNDSRSFVDCIDYDPFNPYCDSVYRNVPFKLTPQKALSAFGIAVLIVTALAGNILVCAAFCYYRRLRTVTNYFIVSLAVSDLMVAAISMPLWLSFEVSGWEKLPKWIDFHTLYLVWEVFDILAGVSSVTSITAVSLDRFFSIIAPLRHRTRMTPVMAMIMISFCWIYSLAVSLTRLANANIYILLSSVFGFFLPLLVVLFCYVSIYIKFRMRSSRQGMLEGDWNLVKTLLIVIGLFVLCWLPFHLYSLFYYYCLSCDFTHSSLSHFTSFMKWMHYLNSCCNPVVYGFFNINFKTAFWAMFHKCLGHPYSDIDLVALSRENSSSQNGTFLRHLKSLRRKLSWKRDVEESIVSNGEMNDNSISMAILTLHLKKTSEATDYQEGTSLLLGNSSTSRSSSKVSDEELSCDQKACDSLNDKAISNTFEPDVTNSLSILVDGMQMQEDGQCIDDESELVFEEPIAQIDDQHPDSVDVDECKASSSDKDNLVLCSGSKLPRKIGSFMPLNVGSKMEKRFQNDIGTDNQSRKISDVEESREDAQSNDGRDKSFEAYSFSCKLYMINEQGVSDSKHINECIEGEQFLDSKESIV